MNASDLIQRALSQVDLGTKYVLGGGELRPDDADARDSKGGCDCSAFVCWALRIPKAARDFAWLKKVNGGWYNTDGIWWDAVREASGFFSPTSAAGGRDIVPGAVLVYPSRRTLVAAGYSDEKSWGRDTDRLTPSIGHVGIVVAGHSWATARVVHCSAGNHRRTGDAIAVTSAKVFEVRSCVSTWCSLIER